VQVQDTSRPAGLAGLAGLARHSDIISFSLNLQKNEMRIFRNASLKPYNTFGLEYIAGTIIQITSEKEARTLFKGELTWKKPLLLVGGGSNLLFTKDFKGTIVCPRLKRIKIEDQAGEHVTVSAGAGVKWDRFVEWCVEKGFSGIENLSGIPGNVGAVPVQNIGAYGMEAKDCILKVRTISIIDGKVKLYNNKDCNFGYRSSVFKTFLKGEAMVTRVYFRLNVNHKPNLGYGYLQEEVGKLGGPTLKNIRTAVLKIRKAKLPDPEIIGNAGSFFKNPVISKASAGKLVSTFASMPVYDDPSGRQKLSAGWLIEQCGWKGIRKGDAGVHEKQALVIVNHGKASGKEILELSEEIRKSVVKKFGIEMEREVEVI
jgi:UDP-N-acetylmuramate dehydrogenase